MKYIFTEYTDDSDYDDFELVDITINKDLLSQKLDDFYIIPEDISHEIIYEKQSEKIMKKMYRYTKHRIPGYDYDELEYTNNCDDKSSWTHCLCQFTCDAINSVDCYTPCQSGCQCKENYVYDERKKICIKPENCDL